MYPQIFFCTQRFRLQSSETEANGGGHCPECDEGFLVSCPVNSWNNVRQLRKVRDGLSTRTVRCKSIFEDLGACVDGSIQLVKMHRCRQPAILYLTIFFCTSHYPCSLHSSSGLRRDHPILTSHPLNSSATLLRSTAKLSHE